MVTGKIERGRIRGGDVVQVIGLRTEPISTVGGSVEMFHKFVAEGVAGQNVGVLLRNIKREEVERGQVLAKPNSITPHTHFEAAVYVLGKDEGGRHTPFFTGYSPQFYFRTTNVTGTITLPESVAMCLPGDNVALTVDLTALTRSPWTTVSASPSARAAAPSAVARSPGSSIRYRARPSHALRSTSGRAT